MGRVPYRIKTLNLSYAEANDPRWPTESQIERALKPFQTMQERNASIGRNAAGEHPIWLRTCYDVALNDKYESLKDQCEVNSGYSVDQLETFDDEALYATHPLGNVGLDGGGVEVLTLRAPMLADVTKYYRPQDALRDQFEDNEDDWAPEQIDLERASKDAQWLVYLVDEEVLTDGKDLIKMMWMDVHGICVWKNRIHPGRMGPFRGSLANGGPLVMLVEDNTIIEAEGREDDRWRQGAVFWH